MREKLLESKVLVQMKNRYVFSEDTVFNSPSAASNMILGRNSNGYVEWVTKDGKTYKEIQESIN
jgi:hypothetical protein